MVVNYIFVLIDISNRVAVFYIDALDLPFENYFIPPASIAGFPYYLSQNSSQLINSQLLIN